LIQGELVALNVEGFPLLLRQYMFYRDEIPTPELQLLKRCLLEVDPAVSVDLSSIVHGVG
jgi:hypothetical protein